MYLLYEYMSMHVYVYKGVFFLFIHGLVRWFRFGFAFAFILYVRTQDRGRKGVSGAYMMRKTSIPNLSHRRKLIHLSISRQLKDY